MTPAVMAEDFHLFNVEHLDVETHYDNGFLWDNSSVDISGGYIGWGDGFSGQLHAYGTSSVNLTRGSVGILSVYDDSRADISGGDVWGLNANANNIVDISGGWVGNLNAHGTSTINLTGGGGFSYYVGGDGLAAYDNSKVNMYGGSAYGLLASGESIVKIYGGSITYGGFSASGTSKTTFYGNNFVLGAGLSLDGNRLFGTGNLAGEWFDGTSWTTQISKNDETATVLLIPEPVTLLLLGIGGLLVRKNRLHSN